LAISAKIVILLKL